MIDKLDLVPPLRIAADVGGTFTDVILVDSGGTILTLKVPSTPPHFEQAVLRASEALLRKVQLAGEAVAEVTHGTTVATNTVLEKRGARTALITTKGFRDILELRRVRAPANYDLFFDKPPSLVDRYLRFEVAERMSATGEVLHPLDDRDLAVLRTQLHHHGVESVAVCLLHSYAFPEHERRIGDFLQEHFPHLHVSLSCDVLPERREYERTATTVVNAYVRPTMNRYIADLREGLESQSLRAPLLVMQSAGGLSPSDDAAQRPVFALESGPAAGVLATQKLAERLNQRNVISFDMGGTTAKAALIEDGEVSYCAEYEVGSAISAKSRLLGGGGEMIRAPAIDIAEVGAGGGSIAFVDRGGGIRVGPRSAGSVPGPACYQQGGTEPTVTDANVVLGYIPAGPLGEGDVTIDLEMARRAIHDHIAAPLGLDVLQAAAGIHDIANARMMRALREVSSARGRDPRAFMLAAFGGSGPVHAAGLAAELGTASVVVPPLPGLFSAVGLLCAAVDRHGVRSCLVQESDFTGSALPNIQDDLRNDLLQQTKASGEVQFHTSLDLRFRGQNSEINVVLDDQLPFQSAIERAQLAFKQEHERLYGHCSTPDNEMQVVAVRMVARTRDLGQQRLRHASEVHRPPGSRDAFFAGSGMRKTQVLARRDLAERTSGPLLIDETDATTVVPPNMSGRLDEEGHIVITPN